MDQAERFSELVGEIYDAALDPSLWSGVVHMRWGGTGCGRLRDMRRVSGCLPHPEVAVLLPFNSNPRGSSLMLALSRCGAAELAPYLFRIMPTAEGHPAAVVSGIADQNARLRG